MVGAEEPELSRKRRFIVGAVGPKCRDGKIVTEMGRSGGGQRKDFIGLSHSHPSLGWRRKKAPWAFAEKIQEL